jgi:hypothetical protein
MGTEIQDTGRKAGSRGVGCKITSIQMNRSLSSKKLQRFRFRRVQR